MAANRCSRSLARRSASLGVCCRANAPTWARLQSRGALARNTQEPAPGRIRKSASSLSPGRHSRARRGEHGVVPRSFTESRRARRGAEILHGVAPNGRRGQPPAHQARPAINGAVAKRSSGLARANRRPASQKARRARCRHASKEKRRGERFSWTDLTGQRGAQWTWCDE
jgi:hypothetical protein